MGLYARVLIIVDGTTIDASDVENEFNAIKDAVNNIEDINVKAGADIDGSKFKDDSVTVAKINYDAMDGISGWHGDVSRIKIFPNDFLTILSNYHEFLSTSGATVEIGSGSLSAIVPIPMGYKATAVRVYAASSCNVTVYECNIADNSATSKGTGNTTAEINITDVGASDTNYLGVHVTTGTVKIYGGYVTIEKA